MEARFGHCNDPMAAPCNCWGVPLGTSQGSSLGIRCCHAYEPVACSEYVHLALAGAFEMQTRGLLIAQLEVRMPSLSVGEPTKQRGLGSPQDSECRRPRKAASAEDPAKLRVPTNS
eukprot:jgi/Botrbrau1/7798/Bobra.0159s0226.1